MTKPVQTNLEQWDEDRVRRAQESIAARVIELETMKASKRKVAREWAEQITEAQRLLSADAELVDQQAAAHDAYLDSQ